MTDKVDELVWKRKDYLYARQTAANVTSAVFEGKEIDSKEFKKYADDIFNWLFQEQEKLEKPKKEKKEKKKEKQDMVLPTPTQQQEKILEAIAGKVGETEITDKLKSRVLEWAFKVHSIKKYPESQASIKTFLDWNKEN